MFSGSAGHRLRFSRDGLLEGQGRGIERKLPESDAIASVRAVSPVEELLHLPQFRRDRVELPLE